MKPTFISTKTIVIIRSVFFFICTVAFIPIAGAQVIRSILTPEQEMLQKAIKDALLVVQTDYVLQTGEPGNTRYYGQRGLPYFNRSYYLGVNADSVIWFAPNVASPWTDDPDFVPYAGIDSITPVIHQLKVRALKEDNWVNVSLPDSNMHLTDLNRLWSLPYNFDGLRMASTLNDSISWLVVCYQEDGFEGQERLFKLSIFRVYPSFNFEKMFAMVREPVDPEKVLGGLLITPHISKGIITIQLWGLLHHHDELGWGVMPIESNLMNPIELHTVRDQLTPINNN